MRVPLAWLADYVDLPLSPAALAEELTLRGMEVAAIEVTGADWTDVVVGRVLDVARHPNADTLWLTRVDVGAGGRWQSCAAPGLVVRASSCRWRGSAPSFRESAGSSASKIRGVVSDGMLCSAAELGLGTDADRDSCPRAPATSIHSGRPSRRSSARRSSSFAQNGAEIWAYLRPAELVRSTIR